MWAGEQHKLIGVKAESQPAGLFPLLNDLQQVADLAGTRQIVDPVTDLRMGVERKQRREHAEGADTEPLNLVKGGDQGTAVLQTQLVESRQLFTTLQTEQAFRCGTAKLNGGIVKLTAESESQHQLFPLNATLGMC